MVNPRKPKKRGSKPKGRGKSRKGRPEFLLKPGRLTEVQKWALAQLRLHESGHYSDAEDISGHTLNSLDERGYIYPDRNGYPALTTQGRQVARMILGEMKTAGGRRRKKRGK